MSRQPAVIPIDRGTLIDLYWRQGLTLPEMAEELGVSHTTVRRRMIEAGVLRRRLGPRPVHGYLLGSPADVLTPRFLKEAYQRRGMSTAQIAAETGYSAPCVIYYLRRAGVPIRSLGSPTKYRIGRNELTKFKRQGLSTRQIAEHYGCSATTVERARRRYGLVSS